MASYEEEDTADLFKKVAISENDNTAENRTKKKKVIQKDDETSDVGENEKVFNNEDLLISKLYSKVVDDIMQDGKFGEYTVLQAIFDMKSKMCKGYYKSPSLFSEIDFSQAEYRCAYLKRYAVCHTGLVKNAMFQFFECGEKNAIRTKEEIINNKHLKVVSLGGGPGNDLVGFCSALQEVPNKVKKLELIVLDIEEGWKSVFPTILRNAKSDSYGILTQILNKEIELHFRKADLTNREVVKDGNVGFFLGQADVLLMVKLASILHDEDTRDLIHNVVDSMKPEAKLIFIDNPYSEEFGKIESLDSIYHVSIKHELGFKPSAYTYPILKSSADVAIHRKMILADYSKDREET